MPCWPLPKIELRPVSTSLFMGICILITQDFKETQRRATRSLSASSFICISKSAQKCCRPPAACCPLQQPQNLLLTPEAALIPISTGLLPN